ncbi:methyltransferase domain-containing protein [Elusimicrobiota bacterium]
MSDFIVRAECPCCQSKKFTELYKCSFLSKPIKDTINSYSEKENIFNVLNDSKYVLLKCINCYAIFQKEILNDFYVEKLYSTWISPKEEYQIDMNRDIDFQLFYLQELLAVMSYFNKVPKEIKVLDHAIGWGQFYSVAKSFGFDTYGTEISPKKIEHATSNNFKLLNINNLKDYSFDFINTEQIFEHLSNPIETLLTLTNSLNQNGIIKVSVPTPSNSLEKAVKNVTEQDAKKFLAGKILNPVYPLEHINCFRKKSITEMCRIAGLKQVKIPLSFIFRPSLFTFNTFKKYFFRVVFKPCYRFKSCILTNLIINCFRLKSNYMFFKKV